MHVNNTFNGITTLRAANMQEKMAQEFFAHTDFHTSAASTFLFVNRWFAIRLDWLVTIYIYLAVFSSLFLKGKYATMALRIPFNMINHVERLLAR